MRVDPIPFMVAAIKNTPGLPASVSVSAETDMHEPGSRHIDVVLEGGTRWINPRMDQWYFSLNHYGPTKQAALETALLVREYLLEKVPGMTFGSVAVDEVEEEQAPFDSSDSVSAEKRFIHRVAVYIYEV